MKKNKAKNKLSLDRETIAVIKPEALEGANGGNQQASIVTVLVTLGVGGLACRIIC
jgi:hypothetical protein